MRQISQRVSTGHRAETGKLSFILSRHFFFFFGSIYGGGITLDARQKSMKRPDENLSPKSYTVAEDNDKHEK